MGITPLRAHRLLTGETRTVSAEVHAAVCGLYRQRWNQLPPERTAREQAAAKAARNQARAAGWPPPMALDDDRIDDPGYRPRAAWRRAHGTGS